MSERAANRVLCAIALGSSVPGGHRLLDRAVALLHQHPQIASVAKSARIKSAPFGGEVHRHFDNAVIIVRTTLSPLALLRVLWSVETRLGRLRNLSGRRRNGPRTLDLDLVHYGEHRRDDAHLTLPHPGAHVRDFVRIPLEDATARALAAHVSVPTAWRARDGIDGAAQLGSLFSAA